MDIAVPSRFACLKIEGDDFSRSQGKSKDTKKKGDKKAEVKKSDKDVKVVKVNGTKKAANAKQGVKKDKKKVNTRQWEEWKQKDDELVNGNFEDDLETAILQSKLDYENKKVLHGKSEREVDKEKAGGQNKKKKNKSMSLDQFLNADKAAGDEPLKQENAITEENFFEKVQSEAKKELNREEVKEKRKKREANIDEIVCQAQFQEKLQQEKSRVIHLEEELEKCKSEILNVKQRNKTLCSLLSHGEMKDRAGALLEIEQISVEKNDLMAELSRLHVENEQLRSKLAAHESQNTKHKDKKRNQKGA